MTSRFADLAIAFRECLDLAESQVADLERENFSLTIQRDEARAQVESLQRLLIEQSTGIRPESTDYGPAHCKHCGDTFTKKGPQERVCPPCRTTVVSQGAERARVGRALARVAEKAEEDVAFS